MKNWKCPHCNKITTSEDDIVMVLCTDCIDCNMEEIKAEHKLITEKLGNIKPFDKEGRQDCLRCGKEFAVKGDIYCQRCIIERKQIDENIKNRSLQEEKQSKGENKGEGVEY